MMIIMDDNGLEEDSKQTGKNGLFRAIFETIFIEYWRNLAKIWCKTMKNSTITCKCIDN